MQPTEKSRCCRVGLAVAVRRSSERVAQVGHLLHVPVRYAGVLVLRNAVLRFSAYDPHTPVTFEPSPSTCRPGVVVTKLRFSSSIM